MNRIIRTLSLAVAAAALTAAPAFAQKGATSPVAVAEVEKSARTAVQITYSCQWSYVCTTDYQLPAEMRLVIESISGKLTAINSNLVSTQVVWLTTQLEDGSSATHPIPPSNTLLVSQTHSAYDFYFMHNIRLYTDVLSNIGTSNNSFGASSLILTGHLVKK